MQKFDREASTWDQDPFKTKLAADIAQAMIEELTPSPESELLEFGCGTGLVTLKLQPMVRSILGVDSSAGMLGELDRKVKERGLTNVATRRLDIESGDSLAGSFDIAVTSMVLHHIRDLRPLFQQFFNVLRPGGRLCIADLDLDDGQFHADNNGVQHHGFDRQALRKMLEDAGFTGVRDRLATEVSKPQSGISRTFTIFLMSATRPF